MKHIDEEALELYVLESEEIKDKRADIETHLKKCAGCTSLVEEIQVYYAEAHAVQEERSNAVSQALTVRNIAVQVPTFTDFGPLSQIRKTWPARVLLFVIRHPYASAGSFAGVFIGAILVAQMLLSVPASKDHNPSYARAKEEFLVVYNKEGLELWRKHIGYRYDQDFLEKEGWDPKLITSVADVDKDGKNDVLAVFGTSDWPDKNAVMCFDSHGNVKWKYAVHRKMKFGNETFDDDFSVQNIEVGDFDNDGKIDVIVSAVQNGYYASTLIRLQGQDGGFVSEYWYSGDFRFHMHDIDGDGISEAFLFGENNGFNLADLVVLDPRAIVGHGAVPQDYTPAGIPDGLEKFHLLIDRSDLKEVATHKRNIARVLEFPTDGVIKLHVGERVESDGNRRFFNLVYHFSSRLNCTQVVGSDEFVTYHRQLEAQGKLKSTLDKQYYENLRRGVQYWNGKKFVPEPTMNKRYLESMNRLTKK